MQRPPELARRLKQIGVVRRADGARLQRQLKPGQRLVSIEGDLWRWDGFVAAAQGAIAAASRLAGAQPPGRPCRTGGGAAPRRRRRARGQSEAAAERLRAAQGEERRLRQLWRECQGRLAQTRETLTAMERQARETEAKLAGVADAKERTQEALLEAHAQLSETEAAVQALGGMETLEADLAAAQKTATELRARVSEAKTELITLEREHRARTERQTAIATECERWNTRSAGAASADRHARTARRRGQARRSSVWPDCPPWSSSSARSS